MIAGQGDRAARALELRRSGMSYAQIGQTMGDAEDPARPICGTAAKVLVKKRERFEQTQQKELGALRTAPRLALQRAGIESLDELCQRTAADLLALQHFGPGSLVEVEAFLKDRGLGLAVERPASASWRHVAQSLPAQAERVLVYSPLYRHEIGEWAGTEAGWRDRFGSPLVEPTHWQPLPQAPAAPVEGNGRSTRGQHATSLTPSPHQGEDS